ncbi:MazG-like family protein [Vagococcus carniphilus]|uniref:MazG-like family protein n=1 Tax=Vagococcus carniphilus TaxID=218144 RepID=UPI00288FCBC0|nr:MazG-like family protein [Vagococcus carniphilus]MDT2848827.1 MazG-like family protein [Vagococcus carniphilus]
MNIQKYQSWVSRFYKKRGWYELNPFIRANFLAEETGEVARAVRSIEIGRDRPDEISKTESELVEDLKEELGDVLDNVFILVDKYDIQLEDILSSHQEKLIKRFEN